MNPEIYSLDDVVLAAWSPAGWGRTVVVLEQGVVIHKVVMSGRAAAAGMTGQVAVGPQDNIEDCVAPNIRAVTPEELHRSPFVSKVLRHGVPGLLGSPRKTLLRWDEITSVQYRKLALFRGRMVIRTSSAEHKLKFLQSTVVIGDPVSVFTHFLGGRFEFVSRAS